MVVVLDSDTLHASEAITHFLLGIEKLQLIGLIRRLVPHPTLRRRRMAMERPDLVLRGQVIKAKQHAVFLG
jgi:hypothetical protein